LERVGLLLFFLLETERPVDRDELEEAIPEYRGDSGRRRFEDDKAALRRAGVPMRTVESFGEVGYELRRRDYELPPLDLTDEEREALALAVSSVDFTRVAWSRLAGLKLGAEGPSAVGTVAELPGIDLLPELSDAARRHRRVSFRYRGEDRVVEPWGLVVKNGRWYVPGWDRARDGQRTFRVDRIEPGSLAVDDDGTYVVPDDVTVADLVPDDGLSIDAGSAIVARLRADRRIASMVAPGTHPAATADEAGPDEVVVEVEVSYPEAFVPWVLTFGELVVVEDPPELRDAVVARLRELAG
jgi:predicted DNA-binding transcriptional regulator YafY